MKDVFKGRHFEKELILFCVRWYLQSPLSYQQLSEMVTERGMAIVKSTIWEWVQAYAPQIKKRAFKHLKNTSKSHHIDETEVKVKGKKKYLYRAIDYHGNTLDFLLTSRKDKKSAIRFFKKVLGNDHISVPGVITGDGNKAYPPAIKDLKTQQVLPEYTRLNVSKHDNDLLEQDHRFVKRRIRYKMWFQEFNSAQRTISGYETMHMIRKGQMRYVHRKDPCAQKKFIESLFGIAA
jgi:transposase, IS6 family